MSKTFDPKQHLTTIGKGNQAKKYLPVAARILWLAASTPRYTVESELVALSDTSALARATITILDEDGVVVRRATDFKSQSKAQFNDFIEKAVTGAIGRALAQLGFGTEFAAELTDDGGIDAPEAAASKAVPSAAKPTAGESPTDWNTFWPWARQRNLPDKAAVALRIGRQIDGLKPAELADLVLRKEGNRSSAAPEAATPGAAPAQSPLDTEVPSAEVALIEFTERAEAGEDYPALIQAAGDDSERFAVLARHAPTLAALKSVVDAAKRRGKFTVPVITAERDRKDALTRRAASFTA